jgi:hypothetical protein
MTILIADQNPGFRKAVKNLLQVDQKVRMESNAWARGDVPSSIIGGVER